MVHRIDRPVSGLVTFAKDSSSAAMISKDFRQRYRMEKRYLAVVPGDLTSVTEFTKLEGDLVKNYSTAVQDSRIEGRTYPSMLEFKCVRLLRSGPIIQSSSSPSSSTTTATTSTSSTSLSLLDIRLLTGRKHQIRAQLSHLGHPVVGDSVYGYMHHPSHPSAAASSGGVSIALHGYLLSFPHPVTRMKIAFTAEPPQNKPSSLWTQLLSHDEDREFISNYIRQQTEFLSR
eukprot:gene27967-36832_t